VALLYRFDHYVGTPLAKQAKGAKRRFYCWIVVFAYAFGLFITMGVMHYFKVCKSAFWSQKIMFLIFNQAAQPALLYLVPSCVLIPLLMALLRGELRELWNYSEEHLVDKDDKKEDKKKKKKENESTPAGKNQLQENEQQQQKKKQAENKKSK
jgi:minor histocompatibility antigen H13